MWFSFFLSPCLIFSLILPKTFLEANPTPSACLQILRSHTTSTTENTVADQSEHHCQIFSFLLLEKPTHYSKQQQNLQIQHFLRPLFTYLSYPSENSNAKLPNWFQGFPKAHADSTLISIYFFILHQLFIWLLNTIHSNAQTFPLLAYSLSKPGLWLLTRLQTVNN